ncbi:glutaredoxin domain-containing protein [Janibacter sp. GS2]|uniref:glutaredoxin domain-containing protein n=1 Tax=Janibacter sp. GS2 TaxID=3442646 RepID=UPI003EBCB3FA
MTRWLSSLFVLAVVVLATGRGILAGEVASLLLLALGVGIAWWLSPLNGRGSPRHRDVTDDPQVRVVIYWRPGCTFYARLRLALGSARKQATWVSIWADPEAAAYVRSVNDGNETVPTVVIDGRPHTNPDPQLVRTALG